MTSLQEQLERHEGLRLKPYRDTVGKLTIGVGRNLSDKGISHDEAMMLLDGDMAEARRDARTLPFFIDLDSVRQDVVTNMVFNLGLTRLNHFRKMKAALEAGDFHTAAAEMLDSKWAQQVGDFPPRPGHPYGGRAWELAQMMRTGKWLEPAA